MKALVDAYTSFATRYSKPLLALVVLLTCVFGFKLTQLKVDSTPYFIDNSHPQRLAEEIVRQQFTSSKEQAFVLVVADEGDVFNADTLGTVDQLTQSFEQLSLVEDSDAERLRALGEQLKLQEAVENALQKGLNASDLGVLETMRDAAAAQTDRDYLDDLILRAAPVHKVRSITNIENISASEGYLEIGKLTGDGELAEVSMDEIRSKAMDNPLYRNILLSDNGRATNIQIEFNIPDHDSPNLVKSYEALMDIVDGMSTSDSIHVGGTPVVNAQIVQVLEQDNAVFFPAVILVVALVLYFGFRRAQGVLSPLLIAIISVIWTMGTMAIVGIKQNVVTTALPVFLITIAVTDSIHYLSAYYSKIRTEGKKSANEATLRKLFMPLLLTSLTTMFGFYSLTVTDLIFVKEFGLVMCVGVLFAFILTVVLLPALLQMTGARRDLKMEGQMLNSGRMFTSFGLKINETLHKRQRLSAISLLIFTVVVVFFGSRVGFDQHNTSSFDEDTRLRQDDAVMNQYLGGTSPLNISFHAEERGTFSKAEAIQALDDISRHLVTTYDTIGYATSPADYLKRIDAVMTGNSNVQPSADALTSEMISQYYLLYESSSGQEIRNVLDESYTNARIALLGHTDQASVWKRIIEESSPFIEKTLPEGIEFKFSGVGNIQKANLDEVISSQINSLMIGVALILVAMIVVLRSPLMGLIGVVPLVLTLLTLFALMQILGIHLDIGTSLIAALVFGIGVDYSVHFLTQLRRYYRDDGHELALAITMTLKDVSSPIIVNSLALAAGFLVLSLSSYAPLAYLGLFVSGTMVLCAFWVLSVVPMLLRLLFPPRCRGGASEKLPAFAEEVTGEAS